MQARHAGFVLSLGGAFTAALVLTVSSCKTSGGEATVNQSVVKSSADRDDRFVENALKSYGFELRSFDDFMSRVDPAEFYEDVETKQRTNFVTFYNAAADTRCSIGLTNEEMSYLKSHPRTRLTARTSPPGRTSSANTSELFFGYKNESSGNTEEFLISCHQSNRRLTMADVTSTVGTFIRFRAQATDVPRYDVCCECKTDIVQTRAGSENLLLKGESIYLRMDSSNDSICASDLVGKRFPLRPGDRHFKPNEERSVLWTTCDEVAPISCGAPREAAAGASGKLSRYVPPEK